MDDILVGGFLALLVLFLVPPAPVLVAVSVVFWLSLSFGGPFHLRLWGAMYPARLRGRVVGVMSFGTGAVQQGSPRQVPSQKGSLTMLSSPGSSNVFTQSLTTS
jgi:hypothetical protein